MKNFETEFKWDANIPNAFGKMKRVLSKVIKNKDIQFQPIIICDTYLDDEKNTFSASKIAIRLREWNGHFELTYKTKTQIVNGKAVREEHTLALEDVCSFKEAIKKIHSLKKWKGINTTNLLPIFSIHNNRTIALVDYQNMQAEIAFDNCKLSVLGRKILFKEIELELKGGKEEIFDSFCKELSTLTGLQPTHCSKVKTACSLLALWSKHD